MSKVKRRKSEVKGRKQKTQDQGGPCIKIDGDEAAIGDALVSAWHLSRAEQLTFFIGYPHFRLFNIEFFSEIDRMKPSPDFSKESVIAVLG